MTGLELDAGGSARAIAALRAELERRDDVELLTMAHAGGSRASGWRRVLRGLHRELLYMPIQLPRRAAHAGADLLHCPVGVATARSRVPLVVTVNDVMALEHPDWFTRANALQQRLVLPRALAAAARVIVPSQYTRERLLATCRLDPAHVDVVPYGVGSVVRAWPGRLGGAGTARRGESLRAHRGDAPAAEEPPRRAGRVRARDGRGISAHAGRGGRARLARRRAGRDAPAAERARSACSAR